MVSRKGSLRLVLAAIVILVVTLGIASAANAAPAQSTTRDEAITELDNARDSIDETLRLLDSGQRDAALEVSRQGYLDHFELVEIPLRIADPELTLDAEETFAEIRGLIKANASTGAIREKIVELRGTIDDAERKLTSPGLGAPLLVFAQAFSVLFREGLEAVLLLSVLLGYLQSTHNSQYKRPILYGAGAAVLATVVTFFAVDAIFSLLPFGREVLEALVALLAVAVLFYVSFWLIARLEQRRWLEFLKARVWTAVSAGSAGTLALIGFTSIYREGFETALFFSALTSFGTGLAVWVAAGALAGAAALTVVAFLIFKYGRKLPIKTFLSIAVTVVMVTSVAFLGNAIHSLQEAAVLDFNRLDGWPRLPIFLAQATGYYPTMQTVIAQVALATIYLLGALYMFFIRPRRTDKSRSAAPDRGTDDRSTITREPVSVPT